MSEQEFEQFEDFIEMEVFNDDEQSYNENESPIPVEKN